MSSPSKGERRYPKRQRTAVAYIETADSQGDLSEDPETVDASTDNKTTKNNTLTSSDNDEDWTHESNSKKRTKQSKKSKVKKPKIKEPKPFPFLDLPAELREEVYKLVVGNPDGVVCIEPSSLINFRLRRTLDESPQLSFRNWTTFRDLRRFRNLRLLRVSKLIYREAAVVLYTKQTFNFHRLSALQTFLLLLRPETLDRLVHVKVAVGSNEWYLMPGVASQMLQLHYLQSLKISGLSYVTSGRNFRKYLDSTGRPLSTWDVNLKSFDKMTGIKLARDMYPFMYPFFNAVIRAGTAVVKETRPAKSNGTELEPEPASSRTRIAQPSLTKDSSPSPARESGADTDDGEKLLYKRLVGADALVQAVEFEPDHPFVSSDREWGNSAFHNYIFTAMNDERHSTRRTAMKEELLSLMAKDSY